jgi:hypothetical protein
MIKLARFRPPLDARLLPEDLGIEGLLLDHLVDTGVAPVVGFMLDCGEDAPRVLER